MKRGRGTFTIVITSTDHYEWQGILRTEVGKEFRFESSMELLKKMDEYFEEGIILKEIWEEIWEERYLERSF